MTRQMSWEEKLVEEIRYSISAWKKWPRLVRKIEVTLSIYFLDGNK